MQERRVEAEAQTGGSCRDIAIIIAQIKKEKIPAVFLENVSDPRLMRQIASETCAAIGGTLYSDSRIAEAYEQALHTLCVKDRDDPLTETIAKQTIKIAQAGVHDAAQLSALAIAELRIR
jgi:ABC-type Zn uptake system ZnuABC Zn-binding protein ZnuA